jgi:hypothetical protein
LFQIYDSLHPTTCKVCKLIKKSCWKWIIKSLKALDQRY